MNILGVDPGTFKSGFVIYDAAKRRVKMADTWDNSDVLGICTRFPCYLDTNEETVNIDAIAIEMVQHYGKNFPAGASLFETCVWIGRFIQQWNKDRLGLKPPYLIYRRDQKLHLCETPRAGDAEIRRALADRYGGDRKSTHGTKKKPGPLFGVKSHCWNALAVAVCAKEIFIDNNEHWLESPYNKMLVE